MSSFRRQVELKAGPFFLLIARLPRIVPFAVVFGLLLAGLLLQGAVGAVLLGVVFLLLAVQLYFAWPVLMPPQRALRAAVLAMLAAAALTRL